MAFAGLLALLDDVASVLDDVSALTKAAAGKTAGVVGDDLALNAEQVSGVRAERELPVVWAVAKGSLVNKAILVPSAIAISAFAPWAIVPLLMAGGAFLCFEGAEKLVHRFANGGTGDAHRRELAGAVADPTVDLVAHEKARIRGAIRTDFVLSAEIIVIALGVVAGAALPTRAIVISAIAIGMTAAVYGLVAAIVKLDDVGVLLTRAAGDDGTARARRMAGAAILAFAPRLMKGLSFVGTAAMFLVGGGILVHGIPPLGAVLERVAASAAGVPLGDALLHAVVPVAGSIAVGVAAGLVLVGAAGVAKRVLR
ncbi:MAG TPA: DUF808 domain-containing protein [Casimicrobiaceae bacterium]|nr:DUF808 domain-containing protein [Casimicrobiaceae bacterium]